MSNIQDELIRLREDEWKKSLRSLPLTDETCLYLIDYQADCDLLGGCTAPAPSLLHICVNAPPCEENEQELVTNQRKWCKGRGLKFGTPEFKEASKQIREMYAQAENDRLERLYKVKPELRRQAENEATELEELRKRISSIEVPTFDKEDEALAQRFAELTENDFVSELKEEIDFNPQNARNTLFRASRALQTNRIRSELASEVMTVIRTSTTHIRDDVEEETETRQQNDTPPQKTEIKRTEIDTTVLNALQQLTGVIGQIDTRLQNLETQTGSIDRKQDRVFELAQSINARQELQSYVEGWYKSKSGFLKKIISAPLKALDIIAWKPAKYAFWHFFGRFAYLLWGLLMLFLIMVCALTAFTAMNYYYPDILLGLQYVATYLWGAALRSGSVLAQFLKPWFGESVTLLLSGLQISVATGLSWMWDFVIGLLATVFNTVAGKVTGGFASLLTSSSALSYLNPMSYFYF